MARERNDKVFELVFRRARATTPNPDFS